jgi:hypothetical protein
MFPEMLGRSFEQIEEISNMELLGRISKGVIRRSSEKTAYGIALSLFEPPDRQTVISDLSYFGSKAEFNIRPLGGDAENLYFYDTIVILLSVFSALRRSVIRSCSYRLGLFCVPLVL